VLGYVLLQVPTAVDVLGYVLLQLPTAVGVLWCVLLQLPTVVGVLGYVLLQLPTAVGVRAMYCCSCQRQLVCSRPLQPAPGSMYTVRYVIGWNVSDGLLGE
jgi:hypothetical protein